MEAITEQRAERILKKYAPSSRAFKAVHNHGHVVANVALTIAEGTKADRTFLFTASILHDLGRLKYPPGKEGIKHGVHGATLLRKEKLPKHALVAERHVGSGITKTEAVKLGLPPKSYVPVTLEQKIICLADSLVFGTKKGTMQQVLNRYKREIGEPAAKRTLRLKADIEKAGSNFFKSP